MDRTVLPGNPAGEAADGVAGAEDRASTALSLVKDSRDNRDNNGRADSRPRAADKTVAMADRAVPIGRSSVGNAPGR